MNRAKYNAVFLRYFCDYLSSPAGIDAAFLARETFKRNGKTFSLSDAKGIFYDNDMLRTELVRELGLRVDIERARSMMQRLGFDQLPDRQLLIFEAVIASAQHKVAEYAIGDSLAEQHTKLDDLLRRSQGSPNLLAEYEQAQQEHIQEQKVLLATPSRVMPQIDVAHMRMEELQSCCLSRELIQRLAELKEQFNVEIQRQYELEARTFLLAALDHLYTYPWGVGMQMVGSSLRGVKLPRTVKKQIDVIKKALDADAGFVEARSTFMKLGYGKAQSYLLFATSCKKARQYYQCFDNGGDEPSENLLERLKSS